jgi:hypothetical protein
MNLSKPTARIVRGGAGVAALVMLSACASSGGARLSTFHPPARSSSAVTVDKAALLHPKHKYFGIFLPNAPASTAGIDKVKSEVGKQPNMDLYFGSWGPKAAQGTANFSVSTAENACAKGMLPLFTWESWDTSDHGTNPGTNTTNEVLWAQPNFAPDKITAGKYDDYIRAEAKEMASLNCPLALRFDQEVNGYWYPWGEATKGMPGTPDSRAAAYVKMWRHVWRIFQNQHATNVLWVWSPNFQGPRHPGVPDLTSAYPGDKYVDWVGIDGYYYNTPGQTFKNLFGSTMQQLRPAASNKPWMIAETGVGTYSDPNEKPRQIKNLLRAVAHRKKFNGFVYFNQFKPYDRSDWRFDANAASLSAFRAGIHRKVYASGKPGSFSNR